MKAQQPQARGRQAGGKVVLVNEQCTSRVSSAENMPGRSRSHKACRLEGPSSQAASQAAAFEHGPSTPPPAKRSKSDQAAQPSQPTKGTSRMGSDVYWQSKPNSEAGCVAQATATSSTSRACEPRAASTGPGPPTHI